jgi:hypothetical protein
MIQFLIYSFFSVLMAVGLYCLWVALRVEFHRHRAAMHLSNGHAISALDAVPVRSANTRR